MDINYKPFSLKYIIFFVLTLTIILMVVYITLYLNAKNTVENQLGANAQSVALSVSLDLMENIEEYKTFLETRDTNSDYYKRMQKKFQSIKAESNIRFIFTERRIDSETIEFILDSEPIESPEYSPPGFIGPNDWKRETVYNSRNSAKFKVYDHPRWGKIIAAYAPIFDENGELLGIVGVNIDSTELFNQLSGLFNILVITFIIMIVITTVLLIKFSNAIIKLISRLAHSQKAEERSASSLSMIKTLLDALDTYLFVAELETDKILFVNAKMKEKFHFDDDAIGKLCYEVMNPCMEERCDFCVKRKLLENPEEVESMTTQVQINGIYYKKADRIIEWYDGKRVHLQYFIDITELKEAEAALKIQLNLLWQAQKNLQTVLDFLPVPITIIDVEEGYIIYANKCAAELFDVPSPESVYGCHVEEFMPKIQPDGEDSFHKTLALDFEEPTSIELVCHKVSGETFEALVTACIIDFEDRKASISVIQDLTAENEYQDMLRNTAEKEREANKAKSEFLSRMSHEIRTPLNAITGMTMIAKTSEEQEKISRYLDKIDDASKHLLDLVNAILDMSKIESGKLDLSYSPIDVKRLLENIINIIHFRVESKEQILVLDIGEDVPTAIMGDELRLSQVITNLLSNANKFTPEGGEITLTVSKQDIQDDRCTLQFVVEDNGIGISPEQQERLFEAFEQADGSTSRTYGGTGLGLAISKQLVEMMGGKIWITSKLNQGARFLFTIEVQICDAPLIDEEKTEMLSDAGTNFKGHTILIAEDIDINREIMSIILEDTGVNIVFAKNGLEAVEAFKNNPELYHLILMDIQMPEMDGYEATHRIRSLDRDIGKLVPIIAMTANVFKEDIEQCLAAGMNDHIGKPIEIDNLFNKMRRYL